jgi:hypothetical protein
MAKYAVHFFCDECGDVHLLPISIALDDGPTVKKSIGDVYAGKQLPTQVATLTGNKTICPNTGKLTWQQDNHQVFLVPTGD